MNTSCRSAAVSALLGGALVLTAAPLSSAALTGHGSAHAAVPVVAPKVASAADVGERVRRLPIVSSVTEAAAPDGYRFFRIQVTQPVDHRRPGGRMFEQRVTLLHSNVVRPMVMYTSGYDVLGVPVRSEPAQIVDGNQLSMEHRFFQPSRPRNPNWPRQLTIWQAATDQHRIIKAFQRIYRQNWLTTGGSKGGMTATYHRRFYPHDVAGSIAYVAPNDVIDRRDRYQRFIATAGTNPGCRERLVGVQRRILGSDRAWFTARTLRLAEELGVTWRVVGSLPKGLEAAVVDLPFAFWQYSRQSDCPSVPRAASASRTEVWKFVDLVSSPIFYSDPILRFFTPYYYQAAHQLGAPTGYDVRIRNLIRFLGSFDPEAFVPDRLEPIRFDRRAMPDIDQWVRLRSTRMLYVYGENDPWSAEPFRCGATGLHRGCHRFIVEGGNHGASISELPARQKARATRMVLRWAGLRLTDPAVRQLARTGRPDSRPTLDTGWQDYLRRDRAGLLG